MIEQQTPCRPTYSAPQNLSSRKTASAARRSVAAFVKTRGDRPGWGQRFGLVKPPLQKVSRSFTSAATAIARYSVPEGALGLPRTFDGKFTRAWLGVGIRALKDDEDYQIGRAHV